MQVGEFGQRVGGVQRGGTPVDKKIAWSRVNYSGRLLLGATLAATATLPVMAQSLASEAVTPNSYEMSPVQQYPFNIPSKPLPQAIADLAAVTGLQVLYTEKTIFSRTGPALKGRYTVQQGLGRLLEGSELIARFTSLNAVTIERTKIDANVIILDSVQVIGTAPQRYEFEIAESATGFAADVDDLPRSVQVLPEQLILDQNADDLADVLTNAAGVTRAHGFGGSEIQVNIRGFVNNRTFVDGSPVSSRYNIDVADVADVDSAEVVLGPASILHGQVSPGGLINIVTKKPQKESANALQVEFDEHGKRKLSLDSTGSLSDTVQYRLILSGEDSESFREVETSAGTFNDGRKSYLISPSFSFTPDENNTYTLRLNHTEQELPVDRGTVAVTDANGKIAIAKLPRKRRLSTQHDMRESKENRIQLDWDHDFNENWTNKLKLGFYEKKFDDYQARPVTGFNGVPVPGNIISILTNLNRSGVQANGLLGRTADTNIDVTENDLFISDSLIGDYELAGIENTLYVGANYHQREEEDTDGIALQDASAIFGPGISLPQLSIININSASQPFSARLNQEELSVTDSTLKEYGLSVQNLSYLTERLNFLAGFRYDYFTADDDVTIFQELQSNGTYRQLASPSKLNIKSSNSNVSGQAGLIYKLADNLSVYTSYSESFTPNYPSVTAGSISGRGNLDPEEAFQFEVGVKSSFLEDKLRLSLSAYDLTRENVLRFDTLVARLNGEERTKGFDLSTTMQFISGLNVLASYSYLDNEIIDDNNSSLNNEGNRSFSIPKNKARIWGSYELQSGRLAGLGFGLGAEHVGSRYGNDANTFKLPSYTTFDAAVWGYVPLSDGTKIRLQGGIKNFTDRTYYPANGSGNTYRINVGDPRTAYFTARLEF